MSVLCLRCKSLLFYTGCVGSQLFLRKFKKAAAIKIRPSLFKKPVIINKSKFRIVYEFPSIWVLATQSRTVLSIPALTLLSSPLVYYLYDVTLLYIFIGANCQFTLVTYIISYFTKNIVGKIYINKEGVIEDVLISSINRFGYRVDKVFKVGDIVFSDYRTKLDKFFGYVTLSIEKDGINYKVNVKNGKFHDRLVCDYLFGRLWDINTVREAQIKAITDKKKE